jgi:hypothetical protein
MERAIRNLHGKQREDKIKELILKGVSPNDSICCEIGIEYYRIESIFSWAIRNCPFNCSLEILDLMIKHGANMNYFVKCYRKNAFYTEDTVGTPLGRAMESRELEIVKFLLQRGAGIGKNIEEAVSIGREMGGWGTEYLKNFRLSILLLSSKLCRKPRIKMLPPELMREIMERFDTQQS